MVFWKLRILLSNQIRNVLLSTLLLHMNQKIEFTKSLLKPICLVSGGAERQSPGEGKEWVSD